MPGRQDIPPSVHLDVGYSDYLRIQIVVSSRAQQYYRSDHFGIGTPSLLFLLAHSESRLFSNTF